MQFDNDFSILLKRARELNIPSKFVRITEDKKYLNIISEITSLIPTGKTLNELYKIFETIQPNDLAIIYSLNKKENSKQILIDINEFYNTLKLDKLRDDLELRLLTNEWEKNFQKEIEDDDNKLSFIETIQEELSKQESLNYSPIQVDTITIFAEMQFKDGRTPTLNDGYEIFDFSVPSKYLPYITWDRNNEELIKIYTGKNLEERPDYSKISFENKEIKNTIKFSVGKEEENITKESYLKGVYNIETNLLKIKIPLETKDNKEIILKHITDSLPLIPKTINEKTISGELFVFDIEINDLILADMLLNNDVFKNYFFMKEMSSSLALKKQLKIFYRSLSGLNLEESEQPSSLVFTITQHYSKGEDLILKTPYIKINISSADSLSVVQDFINIFSRILSIYKSEEEEKKEFYNSFIPEFSSYEEEKELVVKNFGTEARISKLKQTAPDLFLAGYARKCPSQQQPIIIQDDELEEWKNKTFMHKGEVLERQVFGFPPEDPKFNFVCPDDKYPFPGVRRNKLANKDTYPGLPCCFLNDQLESGKSKYSVIYKKGNVKKIKETEGHMIKSDKILSVGRYGTVPTSISDLLKKDLTIKEVRRKGVPQSTNSLIHCISIAIKDKKYLESKDKEKYVRDLRTVIAKQTYPGLCKQEMYDFTDEDILSSLKDSETFLDPNLYYRAIEEGYKINLFIFAPSNNEKKRLREKGESIGTIQLPRFKLFPSQSPRPDRENILIYRTMGSESDVLSYPHCELIVSYEENKEVSVFDKTIYKLISDATLKINRTITWELVNENQNIEVLARNNLYSQLNYYTITGSVATKQYIDEYGKLRGLYLPNDILIIIPPSSPENLEISSEIKRTSMENVLKVFSNPVAYSLDKDGKMDGLWFSILDIVYGIYIPIIPKEKDSKLNVGPGNPLGDSGADVVPRLVKIKRDLDFIIQVLKWLLSLSKMPLDNFMNQYTGIGEITGDSSNIYDFTNIGRTFPNVESIEEGIAKMKVRVPTLFIGDRLFLYSDKMFNGILYLMQMYTKEYPQNIVPKLITRKYLSEEDFIKYSGVALFLKKTDMKTWLNSLDNFPEILSTLSINDAMKKDPYMYIAPDNHIYLIQNVIDGNIQKCLNIGYYWKKYKVNPGFKSPEYDEDEEAKYVLYDISPANTIVPVENHAGESLDFLSILRYNPFSHAAMLRLL